MFRLSGLVSLALAFCCGSLLFWTSQSVQRSEHELEAAQNNILKEEESLRVLTTEWDYLNRPERLEKLIHENFDIDQNSSIDKAFLFEAKEIPEPSAIDPNNNIQEVGGALNPSVGKKATVTIKNSERERFEKLISDVTEEGTP